MLTCSVVKQYRSRRLAARELLSSEATYVEILTQIHDVSAATPFAPLSVALQLFLVPLTASSPLILPLKDVGAIFNGISSLKVLNDTHAQLTVVQANHARLLESLHDRLRHWSPYAVLGDRFMEIVRRSEPFPP
jgi:hypothetical protein